MVSIQRIMKTACLSIMFCFAWALIASTNTPAQDNPIKVKFEMEGKEIHQPFKILLSVEGSAIFEPPITDGRFIFPQELRNYEKVNLRLVYKEYDLDYGDVHLSKFNGEMVFGVDNKPFDEENLPSNPPPDKELILIYYIKFGDTELQVHIYK